MITVIKKSKTTLEVAVGKNEQKTLVIYASAESDRDIIVEVYLNGTNAEAKIIGVVHGQKDAKITFHTLQHHKAPNTTSNLLVKAVLSDSSFLSYEGGIVVDRSAQKTNAYQRNENLLLDEKTHATSKPALEILANDVRCTHGATIATLDEAQSWYLATRGISEKNSKAMIAKGFLLAALPDAEDKKRIEKKLDTLYKNIYG